MDQEHQSGLTRPHAAEIAPGNVKVAVFAILTILTAILGTIVFVVFVVTADKAQGAFERCRELERTATEASRANAMDLLRAAIDACEKATEADASSTAGKAAATRLDSLRPQLARLQAAADAVPDTVSEDWCDRLGERLSHRLLAGALAAEQQKRYSLRAPEAYLRQILGDYVGYQVVTCKDDSGKSTAGYWSCLWNSTWDNHDQCKH